MSRSPGAKAQALGECLTIGEQEYDSGDGGHKPGQDQRSLLESLREAPGGQRGDQDAQWWPR